MEPMSNTRVDKRAQEMSLMVKEIKNYEHLSSNVSQYYLQKQRARKMIYLNLIGFDDYFQKYAEYCSNDYLVIAPLDGLFESIPGFEKRINQLLTYTRLGEPDGIGILNYYEWILRCKIFKMINPLIRHIPFLMSSLQFTGLEIPQRFFRLMIISSLNLEVIKFMD